MPSKALLQRRTTLRTWLTLSAGKIDLLLANPESPPSCTEVQVATDDYIKYSEELEVCQGEIMVVVVVNHCFTSLFGTKGLLSDIIIR